MKLVVRASHVDRLPVRADGGGAVDVTTRGVRPLGYRLPLICYIQRLCPSRPPLPLRVLPKSEPETAILATERVE